MALNIGEVVFGLGANTAGLEKAARQMVDFGRSVDKLARSTEQSDKNAVRNMVAREKALRAALQQTLNLAEAMRRASAPPELIALNTRNFQALTRQLTQAAVAGKDFARSQDLFRARMNKSRKSLQTFQTGLDGKKVGKFTKTLRDLESASVLAVGPLSGLGARIRALGAIVNRSTLAIAGFLGAVAGITIGFAKLISGAISARRVLDEINAGFLAVTGSAILAKEEFEFTSKVAKDLGLGLAATAKEYAKLSAATAGTAAQGEATRKVFLGVAQAGAALRLRADEVAGALKAITQIASKGTVQAEELRGQFGERIPGGFKLAADAMKVTTAELNRMLEAGEVLSSRFIKLLGTEMVKRFENLARAASETLGPALGRLETQVLLFNLAFDEAVGVSDTYKDSLELLTSVLETLTNNMGSFIGIIGGITGAFLGLFGPKILSGAIALATIIRTRLIPAVLALNIAVIANPLGAFATILGRIAIVIAGAIGGFLLMRSAVSATGDEYIAFSASIAQSIEQMQLAGEVAEDTSTRLKKAILNQIAIREKGLAAEQAILNAAADSPTIAEMFGLGDLFGVSKRTQASLAIALLNEELDLLRVQLETISAIPIIQQESELSKGFIRAQKAIQALTNTIDNLKVQQRATFDGAAASTINFLKKLAEAEKILKSITNEEELASLAKQLHLAGLRGADLAQQLAGALVIQQELEDSIKGYLKILKEAPKALDKANASMAKLQAKTQALGQGPAGLEMLKRVETIDAFREGLIKAGVAQDIINIKVQEFTQALEQVDEAQKTFDRIESRVKIVADGIERAFKRIGAGITEAMLTGERSVLNFSNIARAAISEVLQTLIQLQFIDPLITATKTLARGVFSGGISGGSDASLGATAFAANGIAFSNNRIIGGPTLFPAANGIVLGGEAGTEAILPLENVGGKLGVNARIGGGGGSNITINIIDNNDNNVQVQQSANGNGGINIDIVLDRMMARKIRDGGATSSAISDMFGANITPKGR